MVAHASNPSYSRSRAQKDHGSRPAQTKSCQDNSSTNKLGVVACPCHPSYLGGRGRRILVQDQPLGKSIQKVAKAERTRG
jgi:hypothetical protein